MQVNFQPIIKQNAFTSQHSDFRKLFDICAYTNKPMKYSNSSVEHIQPSSKKGKDNLSNWLPTFADINHERGNMPLWKWFKIKPFIPANIQKFLDKYRGLKINGVDYVEAVKKTLNREARGFVSFRGNA